MTKVALTLIGSILKARGLKGEVLLKVHSQSVEINQNLKVVWLGEDDDHLYPWEVEYLRIREKSAFLKLRAINSRSEAEYLKNLSVYVPVDDLKEPEYSTLIGFRVKAHDWSEIIGEITAFDDTGKQAQFTVQVGQKNLLYPAVTELIGAIDWDNRTVCLNMIEDLINL